ncbi:acetyl-CoA C-acetyltransferase [Pseudonocardia ammonioxydans]|uniref:Acetyl-CoA C-acetyltransferase n=1 Tax=Pseudonocardia ammonioxydans TaxID=260086 RepID=A0A1I5D4S6_PSUAM|nr:acetyl-CoA C-acetyltransferase [Pseudonocardia ammonioxydans]
MSAEPEGLARYDRAVSAEATTPAAPEAAHRLLGDLSRLPDWLALHAGWRGTPPAGAAVGVTFDEQVTLMGIPADISWEVTEAGGDRIGLHGTGPMGLTLGLWLSAAAGDGATALRLDAGVGGDPVTGPMGATVMKSVEEALQTSAGRLAELLAGPQEDHDPAAAPVRHARTGTLLDPRTPVIVGVGQVTRRTPDLDRAADPATLAAEAARQAELDTGATVLTGIDRVHAVASASWRYRDLGRAVAEHLGADPQHTAMSARYGGDAGQVLINTAGRAIADGDASMVLVCGGEAGNTLAAAQKAGVELGWPEQPADVVPDEVIGSEREPNNAAETAAGLAVPVYNYALMESALRARSGATPAEHTERITRLWSSFSEVGAANEHAWMPQAHSPERLATADADNRMVTSPYPKLLCANLQVDLAAAVLVTSVAAAEAAGITQDRWVFLHAGAAAYDEWFVSERGDLASSPAIRRIGEAALDHAGLSIDDVRHVDLYSCFPAAVQIAAGELGLPIDDPDRPLSVTGGLTFAGGPGNNYGTHAVATLVERLRADPASYGLSTSLGWYATKHAVGIYSAEPPRRAYRSLQPVLAPSPSRPVLTSYTGPGVLEACTVQYGRDGAPSAAILSVLTAEGARVLVRSHQDEVLRTAVDDDPLGRPVEVADTANLAFTGGDRTPLPAPPAMPVLLDKRGPVAVVTINRPHRRNAVDLRTAELLEQIVDHIESEPDLRVAVVTGAGGTFCAGMDLKAAAAGQFAMTERGGPLGITARPTVTPLIAAVEGHALAGGFELALVADLVVASTESQFGLPEPKRGLVAAAGGVLRVAQRLPRNVAAELTLTGNPVPATRMAELGLVNRLAEPGTVLDAALALAAEITANAPLSVQVGKRIIRESPDWPVEEGFARQSELASVALLSEDAAEGVAAFAEKREPVWKGR